MLWVTTLNLLCKKSLWKTRKRITTDNVTKEFGNHLKPTPLLVAQYVAFFLSLWKPQSLEILSLHYKSSKIYTIVKLHQIKGRSGEKMLTPRPGGL